MSGMLGLQMRMVLGLDRSDGETLVTVQRAFTTEAQRHREKQQEKTGAI
jgi:hypothetical protein